ncbi:MAG TPA: ABC transporter substrate-binding protein [Candidatus Fusicatenibacter intestinipullorum]|nr:ABC transporter substrate-binding protein [Candidatus Fusicatenibacter intestinipullorum]
MSKWKKFTSACLVAALSTALLAGCGGEKKDSAAANADKYVIGASFELTGNVANYGKSTLSGLKLAVDQVNKAGGVNGKQLVVVESDNKSEPAESGNSVTKLITQDKVVAVVGPATSGCVFAATPVVTSNKVPLIAPCATAPAITVDNGQVKEFIFRACFIDPFQGRVMAEFADKTLGVKNVAILHDASSDYSKGLAEVFEKTLNEKGGKVVAKEAFLAKDIDFKAALTKIKAANPEAIYIPGYYEEVAKIIKQTREIGLNVPLIGCDGWDSPKLVEIAGPEALNNTYFSSAFSVQDQTESVQKFIADYKAMYQKDPDIFCMQGYNAGLVLADALKRAGDGADGTKLAAAIAATKDLPVASGKLTYDKDHNPIISAIIIEMKDGVQSFKEKISL